MDTLEQMDGQRCVAQAYDAIFHGNFESAIFWFGQAIEKEPDNASYYYKLSITCARSGRWTQAHTNAQRAVELDPGESAYAMHLQTIEAKLKVAQARDLLELSAPDIEGAKAKLYEAEKLDPLSAEAKLLLGLACRMQGDYRGAIAYLRDTLQLEPLHEEAKRLLWETRSQRRRILYSSLSYPKPKRNR